MGLFVKYPEAGKVKTRLAKTIGFEEAARIYSDLAKKNFEVLKKLQDSNVELTVFFDPPEKQEAIKYWLPEADYYWQQSEGDLDQRLTTAFHDCFERSSSKVVVLGSDTLDLNEDILRSAIMKLDQKEIVIGPAKDGGYYLIGMTRFIPEVFQNIPWSTPQVLAETIKKIKEQGYTYQCIEMLEDFDEIKKEDVIHERRS